MASGHTGDTGSAFSAEERCQQFRALLDRVGDRWTPLALVALREGAQRFNELRRTLEGVSPRMLTRSLRALERDGLVLRTVVPSVPPQVSYALTPLGQSLLPAIDALLAWVVAHQPQMDAARRQFDLQAGPQAVPGSTED